MSDEPIELPPGPVSAVRIMRVFSRPPSASIIQSWLFFGLASEALGRDVSHDEFFEPCAVGASETSIDLRIPLWFWSELKARWKRLRNTLSTDEYQGKERELKQCCASVSMTLRLRDYRPEDGDTELSLIVLSVHMLLYLISQILSSTELLQTSLRFQSTQLLIQRMLKNGWCRKRLNFVESLRMFYPAFYLMSSFRPSQGKNEDHESCTPVKCYVMTGLIEPLHRTDNCQCQDVHVPLEQVLSIVAAGGIPLIRIGHPPSGEFSLEVVPYTLPIRFTAISHVWADRQLGSTKNALPGCQVEYLDSTLAALPRRVKDRRLRDWLPKRSPISGPIEPPSRAYEYFWLDTFCIPQDIQHTDLKHKAIGSMNFIYAAAAQTLVYDSGLQKFDAGQRSSSLVRWGWPTFYAPTDKNVLDVLAHLCASNWMGRAWTLQEGFLSGHLIFPLKGSLAYLWLLNPNGDERFALSDIPLLGKVRQLLNNRRGAKSSNHPSPCVEVEAEPLRHRLHREIFKFAVNSLNIEEHGRYARGSADRGARFINAHSRLQSRTTTMTQDLPHILMNMSGMNSNLLSESDSSDQKMKLLFYGLGLLSESDSSDQKMKLLFYGLGLLPVELLFSECARLGRCEMDSWIPREIVPETFSGNHVLRLGADGFTFHQQKGDEALKFFLISRSFVWPDQVLLSVSDRPEDGERCYVIKAATSPNGYSPASSNNGWCILFEDDSSDRAVRFVISRRNGNKLFLHFDCPLRISRRYDDPPAIMEQLPSYKCIARPADSQEEFIIERSSTSQSFSMARPQNPEQCSDRLDFISQTMVLGLGYVERYCMRWLLGDLMDNSWLVIICYAVFIFMQGRWVDRALRASVLRAWSETYSPTWSPDGPWKWFWKMSNYEPLGPFATMMKHFSPYPFLCWQFLEYPREMVLVGLYWYSFFPPWELASMIFNAFVMQAVFRYFQKS